MVYEVFKHIEFQQARALYISYNLYYNRLVKVFVSSLTMQPADETKLGRNISCPDVSVAKIWNKHLIYYIIKDFEFQMLFDSVVD